MIIVGEIVRQGDVLLRKIKSLPQKLKLQNKDNGRVIIGYGEVSGHTHGFTMEANVSLFANDDLSARYLVTEEPVKLIHDEHEPISLDVGVYEVIQQREYTPKAIRYVLD